MFCREQVARFTEHQARFEAKGARVYAIGNGTAPMARDFVETFGVSVPVYTDPGRATYRLAGLKRRFGLGLQTIGMARRAMAAGHRQGMTRGDPWQQGGVLVIDRDGALLWRHVDGAAGDNADPEAALAALP